MENEKDTLDKPSSTKGAIFPALVVKVIDEYQIAINRGAVHGLKPGLRFLIYSLSTEEILDPETQESLGHLEIVRGTGTVTHVQEKLATIESNMREVPEKRMIKNTPISLFLGIKSEEIITAGQGRLLPFDEPTIGDRAKPI